MEDLGRRDLGAVALSPLLWWRKKNPDGTPKPSRADEIAAILDKVTQMSKDLALTGPIQSQLSTIRDSVESIGVRLNKTEPLIAARIEALKNSVAELQHGSEQLNPFA